MKKSIYIIAIIVSFTAGAFLLTSCGGNNSTGAESSEQHDYAETGEADFLCPMHPEITGKEGDKCSKCGMFLTKSESKPDEMKEHQHEMDTVAFSCPMHPNEKGVKGDKCSKCKMDLVASTGKMSAKGCNHKDGKTCGMCAKKEGIKCNHKKGETCSNCKEA